MYTGTQRKYAAQLVVFIELGYDGIRLYGHLHPGGKKAAFMAFLTERILDHAEQ